MTPNLSRPIRSGPVGDTSPFGRKLRQLREDRDLTLRQVSKLVGLSPTYLSQVERGEALPPAEDKVIALAGLLEQDPDELLALAGRVASDLTSIIRTYPRSVAALLRAFETLPAEAVDAISQSVVQTVQAGDGDSDRKAQITL
ncbi:MAG: helix-turn-helix domain-containing protein [Actinomycetota bacterium]